MSYYEKSYVEGSTARKLNRNYEPYYRDKAVRKARKAKNTVQVSPIYAIMIVSAIIFMAFFSINYVALQSDVTNLREEKGELVNQYEELKTSNDLYYESLMSSVNLKEIERIAVEELGMKMAGQGQVITYSDEIDDYVKQYVDLPN